QTATFEPGEMKLYLVAPRSPGGNGPGGGRSLGEVGARAAGAGAIALECRLAGVKMPWPLTVVVKAPDGKELFRVHRATDKNGRYVETFPIGSNAPAGSYQVEAWALGLAAPVRSVELKPQAATPSRPAGNVRIFDAEAIRKFLAGKPEVVVAFGKG